MSSDRRKQLSMLMGQIEETWGHLDTLFNSLNVSNGWGQKHGTDWTFADVPYHLAYCNRDLVGRGIEMGPNLPQEEQVLFSTNEELNEWNRQKFAERPPDQTVSETLAEMYASRDYLRRLTANMEDKDLERPFWMPLFMGWGTARVGLEFCRTHDWSEFTQLRVHMGRSEPIPSPALTAAFLNDMMNFMPLFLNHEAAAGKEITAVMAFTDPGAGAWTIHVVDANVTISRGATRDADLVITQSAETFEKARQGIIDPMKAMQAGEIQVSNFENLAVFGQLFPM